MSASDKGGNQDLFAEAHLPPSLNALVLDLGAKMSILVEEAVEGKSYMTVECPAGAQLIRDIYNKYNEIFVKVRVTLKAMIYVDMIIEVGFGYPATWTVRS